jgi:hypothetical protein
MVSKSRKSYSMKKINKKKTLRKRKSSKKRSFNTKRSLKKRKSQKGGAKAEENPFTTEIVNFINRIHTRHNILAANAALKVKQEALAREAEENNINLKNEDSPEQKQYKKIRNIIKKKYLQIIDKNRQAINKGNFTEPPNALISFSQVTKATIELKKLAPEADFAEIYATILNKLFTDKHYKEIKTKLSPDDEVDADDIFSMKCIKYNIASFFLMDYKEFKLYLEESDRVFFANRI